MEFINMMEEVTRSWTVVKVLGQGCYGEVKMIVNKQTEEARAMKVVDTSKGEWCSADIKQEIYIHKALKHANIVRFFGQQSVGQMAYLFLEYCSGGELFDRIQPGVGLEEPQAHRYFVQLMAAVEYLHRLGVTHRDIKPENILLDESDNLKLADFGFAAVFRRRSGSVSVGSIERLFSRRCGSPSYMAPEILGQTEFRAPPADLWACGVVLTAMLTGELPWVQASDTCQQYQDWLEKKIYVTPWNKIPPTPLSLLSKLLQASPEGRISIPDIKSHRWFTQTQRAGGNLLSLRSACKHNNIPRTSCGV